MKHLAVAIAILFTQMAHGQVKELLETYHEATTTEPLNEEAFFLSSGHAIKMFKTSVVGTANCLNSWSTLLVMLKKEHTHIGRGSSKVVMPKDAAPMTDYEAVSMMLRLDQASVEIQDDFVFFGDTITLCLSMHKKGSSVAVLNKGLF